MKVVVMIFLKGAHPSVVIVTMVYQKDAGMDSKVLPSTFCKRDNDDDGGRIGTTVTFSQ